MGYYADRSTGRGQLYLLTREEEPFCAHQFHIEIHSSENDLPLRTLGKLEVIFEGDGSLNETFSITEKDDTEFFAGDVISRILVPHPALGFPHSVTLTYKSYSGWLSKGLPHWTVQKILLTDSWGKKMSLCENDIFLESDKKVYLKLQSGDCHVQDENDVTASALGQLEIEHQSESTTTQSTDEHSTSGPFSSDDLDKFREKTDIINLGTNFKITQNNKTYSYSEGTEQLPWQPVLEGGNSLERDTSESSRNFRDTNSREVFEPILKGIEVGIEVGRAVASERNDATENSVQEQSTESRPTTHKGRKTKQVSVGLDDVNRPRDNPFFTIQLLPFRLGELIERAERYARETLLPLISEQAPRFFGFGVGDFKNDRTPKYFPPLGEISEVSKDRRAISERKIILPPSLNSTLVEVPEFEDEIAKNGDRLSDNQPADKKKDTVSTENIEDSSVAESQLSEARSDKNILSLVRGKTGKSIRIPLEERSVNRRNYYTNLNGEDSASDDDLRVVHIDLPTYKPPTAKHHSRTLFPYSFEPSAHPEQIRVIPIRSEA